jgi:PAS domain S-box-containing protein
MPASDTSRLPIRHSEKRKRGHLPPAPNVLLVDDQPARLLTYESILSGVGVNCVRALSGGQALQHLLKSEFAVILLDVSMPEMDGFETARLIRQHPRLERTPIIFVTGVHLTTLDQLKGYEIGAIDYVSLPIAPEILRGKVAILVELYQRRAELQAIQRDLAAARKRLQGERGQAEERYRAIFEHPLHLAIVIEAERDADGTVRDWRYRDANANALALLGLSREELIDQPLSQVLTDRAETISERCRKVLESRAPLSYEACYAGRDFLTTLFPLGTNAVVSSGVDITARKAAERAQTEGERRYRAFFASTSEGIWRYVLEEPLDITLPVDAQIEHIYRHAYLAELNDAMAHMYGYERGEELVGARVEQMLPPTDEASTAYLRRVVELNYRTENLESVERGRDGGILYFANSMVPQLVDGKLVGAWGLQRDITDTKQAQARLQEADRRKNEFLAVLAHELRNPLAPLRNGLHILRLRVGADDTVQRTVAMMDRQMTHLVRLVDDLLDVSRITHGRLDLKVQRVSLTDVLASAVEATRSVIEAKGHELAIDVQAKGLMTAGDPDRLAQVFANLLTNSAKYTEQPGQIALVVSREGDEAVIAVHDTGIGIPHESLESVFEMFSQVGSNGGRADGGLGIGLSLVRALVRLHRGSVSASSAGLGKGSTFTVRLPIADVQVEALNAEVRPDGGHGPPHRVLIADDNADAAQSLAMLLEIEGHDVRVAVDGQEAVELAREFHPHIIFMDVGMPRLSGHEATQQIRSMPDCTDTLIFALTGWGQLEDRKRSEAAGMNGHLTKPVKPEELKHALALLDSQDLPKTAWHTKH